MNNPVNPGISLIRLVPTPVTFGDKMGSRTPFADQLKSQYPDDMQVTEDMAREFFEKSTIAHAKDAIYRAALTIPEGKRVHALWDVMALFGEKR